MTITKQDIVDMAREYKGVPYRHQGRSIVTGVDCAGLLALIAGRIGLEYPDNFSKNKKLKKFKKTKELHETIKPKSSKHGRSIKNLRYTRNPEKFELQATLDFVLEPINNATIQPGDILLLKIDVVPQHVAIVGNYEHGGLSMIHSYSRVKKVVEHRFAKIWAARVVAAYQIPGVM